MKELAVHLLSSDGSKKTTRKPSCLNREMWPDIFDFTSFILSLADQPFSMSFSGPISDRESIVQAELSEMPLSLTSMKEFHVVLARV